VGITVGYSCFIVLTIALANFVPLDATDNDMMNENREVEERLPWHAKEFNL
jgi:hypothetical protein